MPRGKPVRPPRRPPPRLFPRISIDETLSTLDAAARQFETWYQAAVSTDVKRQMASHADALFLASWMLEEAANRGELRMPPTSLIQPEQKKPRGKAALLLAAIAAGEVQ